MSRLARLERAILSLVSVGYLPYLIPVFLGWTLGASVSVAVPGAGRMIHPKYGGLALVAVAGLLALSFIYAIGRWRSARGHSGGLAAASLWVGGRFAFLAAVPILGALTDSVEAKHPFRVIALALTAAGAVAASVYSLSGSGPAAPRPRRWAAGLTWTALIVLAVTYAVVFSKLSIANHLSFNTRRADLGFYVSIFRRSSLGDLLGCSLCGGGNHLSGHFDPLLVLLSPSFWVLPKAETLLVLQSVWLASSIFPLFLLARHYGLGRGISLCLCLCFCAYPGLHGANLFDFHSLVLLVPLALLWFWAWETDRERLYWVVLALMLLCREDVALLAIVFGVAVLMGKGRGAARLGGGTIVISAVYFLAVKLALMDGADPLRPGKGAGYVYYYANLVPKGQGTAGLVTSLFTNPEALLNTLTTEKKALYILQLFVPVLFLPFYAVRGRITLAYGLAFTMLVTREFVPTVHFHYSALLVPFVFALTASALGRLQLGSWGAVSGRALAPAVMAAIVVSSGVLSWKFGGAVPNATFRAGFRPLKRSPKDKQVAVSAMLDDYCRVVKPEQVVAASSAVLPHLARCPKIVLREKRYDADILVWKRGRGNDHALIEREIKRGSLRLVKTLGRGYAAYETRYTKADKRRLRRALKGGSSRKSKAR